MRRFIRQLGLLCGSSSGVIPVVAVIILAVAAVGVVGTASIVQQSNLDDRGLAFVTGNQYGSGGVSKTTSTGNVKTSTPKPVTGNSAAQNPNSNPGSVPNPGAKADTQNSGKNGSVTPATGNSGSNNNNNNSNNSNSDKAKKDSKSSGSGGSGTVKKVEPKEFAGTGPVGNPIGSSVIPGYSQTIKQQQSATQGRPQQTPVAPAPGAQAGQQQGTGNPNGSGGSAGTTGTTQNFQQGTQPANQTSPGTAPVKATPITYAPGAGAAPQKPTIPNLPTEGTTTDRNLVQDLQKDANAIGGPGSAAVPESGNVVVRPNPTTKPPDYVPQQTFDSQLVRCCVPTSSGGEYCYNTNRASCQARDEARESGIAQLPSQPRPVDTAPVPLPTVFRELERKPVGGTCTSGSECGSGQCSGGRCVVRDEATCSRDTDCGSGTCENNKCYPGLVRCCVTENGRESCYNTNRASCQARQNTRVDGLVPKPSTVPLAQNIPVQSTPPTFAELRSRPVGGTCSVGNDCGSGLCSNGRCVARDGAACTRESDCNSGICNQQTGKCFAQPISGDDPLSSVQVPVGLVTQNAERCANLNSSSCESSGCSYLAVVGRCVAKTTDQSPATLGSPTPRPAQFGENFTNYCADTYANAGTASPNCREALHQAGLISESQYQQIYTTNASVDAVPTAVNNSVNSIASTLINDLYIPALNALYSPEQVSNYLSGGYRNDPIFGNYVESCTGGIDADCISASALYGGGSTVAAGGIIAGGAAAGTAYTYAGQAAAAYGGTYGSAALAALGGTIGSIPVIQQITNSSLYQTVSPYIPTALTVGGTVLAGPEAAAQEQALLPLAPQISSFIDSISPLFSSYTSSSATSNSITINFVDDSIQDQIQSGERVLLATNAYIDPGIGVDLMQDANAFIVRQKITGRGGGLTQYQSLQEAVTSLQSIPSSQPRVLRIIAHGNTEGIFVDGYGYTPEEFANALTQMGLPDGVTIVLDSCYTGRCLTGQSSVNQRFIAQLSQNGYQNVESSAANGVVGYEKGNVTVHDLGDDPYTVWEDFVNNRYRAPVLTGDNAYQTVRTE